MKNQTNTKRPTLEPPPGKLDWLAVVIGGLGGIKAASERFGVNPDTIVRWLERGVGTLPFNRVVEIANAGGLPVSLFRNRIGPFDYESYPRGGGGAELSALADELNRNK
jgi:hypothetical protein